MSLADDLRKEVRDIFQARWYEREGRDVPDTENITLSNEAVTLDGTVLYADLVASTTLVNSRSSKFAAEIYKAFLYCAAKVIRESDGEITAYDGDRIMAVFMGGYKNTNAAKAALRINWCMDELVNPLMRDQYPDKATDSYRAVVGIDTGKLFVAKTGIRGSNDLVWVGRAANYAAKLCDRRLANYNTWITADVYNKLDGVAKMTSGEHMWHTATWEVSGQTIYGSTWRWAA